MNPQKKDSLFDEPPPQLSRLSARHVWLYFGPGAIIASVTNASGELVFASRSGAIFGYTMLWCFLLAGIAKGILVYTAARHITLTGEHPIASWRSLPGPPLWFPLMIGVTSVVVMPIAFSALPEILATYIHSLFRMPMDGPPVSVWLHNEWWMNVWATLVLTGCLLLAVCSSYNLVERISTVVLGLVVICIAAAVVACAPRLTEIMAGLLVPRVTDYEPWVWKEYADFAQRSPWLEVALYLGAVGGGAADYVGYIGMLREKGWGLAGKSVATRDQLEQVASEPDGAQLRRARIWTRAPMLDTSISLGFVVVVTLMFAILGALVLHPNHAIPDGDVLLEQQEAFLTLLHPRLSVLYRVAVFFAFIGTVYGAFEIYHRILAECLVGVVPRMAAVCHSPSFRIGGISYCFVGGMILIWLPEAVSGNVVNRLTLASVLGPLLNGLWCFAMLWTDRVRLPALLRMNVGLRVATFIAGAVMTALGVQIIVALF